MVNKYPITRKIKNKHYVYFYNNGKKIDNQDEIDRINKLRIPPAYKDVQIYSKDSKKQYTAKDDKGRIQVGYHPVFIIERNRKKFRELIIFANLYPKIMKNIETIIKNNKKDKEMYTALAIKLLDYCKIRPGNEKHLKNTGSYGTTTLCKKHIKQKSNCLKIEFKGKSGVINHCKIKLNTTLAKNILSLSKNLKNEERIFDSNITNIAMNNFLKKYDEGISVKTFRTYHANIIFIQKILNDVNKESSEKERNKQTVLAIKEAADYLHHRPSTFKNSYLFTPIRDLYVQHPIKFKKTFNKNKLNKSLISFINKNTEKKSNIPTNWK
jgi:DNA topoisomerase-1